MLKFSLKYEEGNETVERTLVLKGLGFYIETEDGLKNPFFYANGEVIKDCCNTLVETGKDHIIKTTKSGIKYEVTEM